MDAIVPNDWKIEKLAEGFGWAEGPIWVKEGNYLLFTDVPGNKMWKWSEKGGLEKFLDPSGAANPDPAIWREAGANGLAILDARTHPARRHRQPHDPEAGSARRRRKRRWRTLFDGKKFSSPNDVAKMKSGVLFFTDPPYGFAKVRRRAAEGNQVQRRVPHGQGRQGHGHRRRAASPEWRRALAR